MPVRRVYECDRCGRESDRIAGHCPLCSWLVLKTESQRVYLCASCHQSFEKFLNPGDPFS